MGAVADLRSAFLATGASPHPSDSRRVEDDRWLSRFLDQHDGDQAQALKMLIDTCAWRKSFGANELDLHNVNVEYLKEGMFYPRGRDLDGHTILIFKTKKHVKGQRKMDDLLRCLVYWFERLDKVERLERISIFFDMENTGLSNMDLEFTKYIVNLFKLYYPDFLNYIFIYELPWILNGPFKIVKALLPAKAVERLKFITKASNNLTQFISLDQAQKCWGGNDDYAFSFAPVNLLSNNDSSNKKVTFADPGSPVQDAGAIDGDGDDGELSMMSLSPRNVIVFANNVGSFTITNTHDGFVAYKIKTTAPMKTKVRPTAGTLAVGGSETVKISITFTNEVPNSSDAKIKFLVSCTPVASELSPQETNEIWKDTSKLKVEQRRMQCAFPTLDFPKKKSLADCASHANDGDKEIVSLNQSISSLKTSHEQLNSQLKSLKTLQLINVTLSTLLLCLIVYFFHNWQFSETYGEFCNGP